MFRLERVNLISQVDKHVSYFFVDVVIGVLARLATEPLIVYHLRLTLLAVRANDESVWAWFKVSAVYGVYGHRLAA